ncbi:MAG: serine hydrolase [Candidatus Lokiarchaeota archaeon]|nr:serine hydrolase [Candidatus Lokiarchaeota archaeon]
MRYRISIFLFLYLFSGSLLAKNEFNLIKENSSGNDESFQQLESRIELLRNYLHIPGCTAGIIKNKELIWVKGFGYSNIEEKKKAADTTCYHCASITKSFGAVTILKLIEDGTISLDDLVLPGLNPVVQHYGINLGKGDVRIRHLLSHTSDDPPGTYFRYDGDKYATLTKIIMDASGESFEFFLENKILIPVRMISTIPCTNLNTHQDIKQKLAQPYKFDDQSNSIPGKYTTSFTTAAGLVSSVEDLAKFSAALDENKLLNAASKAQMFEPVTLRTGGKIDYGLGWFVENVFDKKLIWTFGYGYCSSGLFIKVPDLDLTFIILSNCDRISRPFAIGLPNTSIIDSQFALEFLKLFVFDKIIPQVNFPHFKENMAAKLTQNKDVDIRKIIQAELRSYWNMSNLIGDVNVRDNILNLYAEIFFNTQQNKTNETKLITQIDSVDKKEHYQQSFSLNEDKNIHVHAVGDGGYCEYFGMYDKIWIENAITHEEIWRMKADHSDFAGGHPRNRMVDINLKLPKGDYIVHFDNSASPYNHYTDNWEAFPPDGLFWGIAIYAIGDGQK